MKENNEQYLSSLLTDSELNEVSGADRRPPGMGFEDHELSGPYPREPKDPPVKS